jgi:hypothetical protein
MYFLLVSVNYSVSGDKAYFWTWAVPPAEFCTAVILMDFKRCVCGIGFTFK